MTDPRIEAAALEDATDVVWSRSMGEIGVCCHDRERDDYKDAEEIAKEAITAYLAAAENAATITTVEGLDALPEDAVIIADTVAYQKCGDHWDGAGRTWDTGQLVSDLPARVIHWGAE